MYTMVKKVTEIYSRYGENVGKRFFFGGNFPLNGGKAVKKKSCVVYGKSTYMARVCAR